MLALNGAGAPAPPALIDPSLTPHAEDSRNNEMVSARDSL
jgi:hypothetical protein